MQIPGAALYRLLVGAALSRLLVSAALSRLLVGAALSRLLMLLQIIAHSEHFHNSAPSTYDTHLRKTTHDMPP